MTDTTVLDAMMKALERNPLTPDRLDKPIIDGVERSQYRETDERPFYARREVERDNRHYDEILALFHGSAAGDVRLERPRRGECEVIRTFSQTIDGHVWTRTERCGGLVHAVETRVDGAMRVDGACLSCGTQVHRAGLLTEKG